MITHGVDVVPQFFGDSQVQPMILCCEVAICGRGLVPPLPASSVSSIQQPVFCRRTSGPNLFVSLSRHTTEEAMEAGDYLSKL